MINFIIKFKIYILKTGISDSEISVNKYPQNKKYKCDFLTNFSSHCIIGN